MAVVFSVHSSPVGHAVPKHSGPNEEVTHMSPSGHGEQPVLDSVDAGWPQGTPAPVAELPVQDARRDKHTIQRHSGVMRSRIRVPPCLALPIRRITSGSSCRDSLP